MYADPSDPISRELGVKRVKGWASRGKLPHAIDSTTIFVEIWLRDGLGGHVPSVLTEHELRLMYTIAFVRFVNGVVDAQQKGAYAQSIASIADSLGLPQWFVDLRHTGTHDILPSLTLLRSGCAQALHWLNVNYWMVYKEYMSNSQSESRMLLQQYKDLAKGLVRQEDGGLKGPLNINSGPLAKIVDDVVNSVFADNYRQFLIPVLLEPGYLIPLGARKRCQSLNSSLPPEIVAIWLPALKAFHNKWEHFSTELLASIAETLATSIEIGKSSESTEDKNDMETDVDNEVVKRMICGSVSYMCTLVAWAQHIMKVMGNENAFDIADVIEACAMNPNIYTQKILLDAKASLSSQSHQDLLTPIINHINVISGVSSKKDVDTSKTVMDPAKFKEALEAINSYVDELEGPHLYQSQPTINDDTRDSNESGNSPGSNWTLASSKSWANVPIGCLPGVGFPQLDLPLEVDDVMYAREMGVLQIPSWRSHDAGNSAVTLEPTAAISQELAPVINPFAPTLEIKLL
ncbi:rRNA-processing protein las1 [Blyttiomyces sp. JEL0837]|nr:rRNA-processing protein las1 [Blyttiomyces sp. JEL0837]